MPGGWPISYQWGQQATIGIGAASRGTIVTTPTTPGTLGAWAQLTASTPINSNWIYVYLNGQSLTAATGAYAVNIGVGTPGNEVAVLSNIILDVSDGSAAVNSMASGVILPFAVPAGTAISAQVSSTAAAAQTLCVAAVLFGGGMAELTAPGPVDTIGFLLASTTGTNVDPGTTANTKGVYSQLIASTTNHYRGFAIQFDNGTVSSGQANAANWLVDIAIGASGSEVPIISNFPATRWRGGTVVNPNATPLMWIPIPSGTRISARAQSNVTNSIYRDLGVSLFCVR